jgi:hypothetical protein
MNQITELPLPGTKHFSSTLADEDLKENWKTYQTNFLEGK